MKALVFQRVGLSDFPLEIGSSELRLYELLCSGFTLQVLLYS